MEEEVNLISWNERKPKLDIRDWDENHEKMGRITLSKDETEELKKLLTAFDPAKWRPDGLRFSAKTLSWQAEGYGSYFAPCFQEPSPVL